MVDNIYNSSAEGINRIDAGGAAGIMRLGKSMALGAARWPRHTYGMHRGRRGQRNFAGTKRRIAGSKEQEQKVNSTEEASLF